MTYVVFPRFVSRPTFKAMRQRNASEVTSTPSRCLVLVSRYFWAGSQKAWEERPLEQAMEAILAVLPELIALGPEAEAAPVLG